MADPIQTRMDKMQNGLDKKIDKLTDGINDLTYSINKSMGQTTGPRKKSIYSSTDEMYGTKSDTERAKASVQEKQNAKIYGQTMKSLAESNKQLAANIKEIKGSLKASKGREKYMEDLTALKLDVLKVQAAENKTKFPGYGKAIDESAMYKAIIATDKLKESKNKEKQIRTKRERQLQEVRLTKMFTRMDMSLLGIKKSVAGGIGSKVFNFLTGKKDDRSRAKQEADRKVGGIFKFFGYAGLIGAVMSGNWGPFTKTLYNAARGTKSVVDMIFNIPKNISKIAKAPKFVKSAVDFFKKAPIEKAKTVATILRKKSLLKAIRNSNSATKKAKAAVLARRAYLVKKFRTPSALAKKPLSFLKNSRRIGTAVMQGGLREGVKSFTRVAPKASGLAKTGSTLALKGAVAGAKLGAKLGAKGLGKAAGLSVLRKIPGIGLMLGLYFGIDRIKKGDILGGTIEIASGIASTFPGLGTVVSLGLDAINIFRDISGKSKAAEAAGKDSGVSKFAQKTFGKEFWYNFPGIGLFMRVFDSVKLFKAGKSKEALNLLGEGVIQLIPGAAIGMALVAKVMDVFSDAPKETDMSMPSISNSMDNSKKGKFKWPWEKKKEQTGDRVGLSISKPKSLGGASMVFESSNAVKPTSDFNMFAKQTPSGIPNGLSFLDKNIDISGVNPVTWNNFSGMVDEYNQKTGKSVQVNSAFRSYADQQRLYNIYGPGRAALPGRSMHGYGVALDINSQEANEMHSMGLMNKWKFTRPVTNEPWHIETAGIDRDAIRKAGIAGVDASNTGDPYEFDNKMRMSKRINNTSAGSVIMVHLDDSTVEKLLAGQDKIAEKHKAVMTASSAPFTINGRS